MEKLFQLIVGGFILITSLKVLIYWITQKLLTPEDPSKRNKVTRKVMESRASYTSNLFNELLKNKKLDYSTINSINQILRKYAKGKKYNNNIHLIYSVLKHEAVRNQDLANIQFILDCAKNKKVKQPA